MLKTAEQVEADIFTMVKHSALGAAIRGSVYRKGMRPDDATTEDIVVAFVSGTDKQMQRGLVVLNIYIPDITFKGKRVVDKKRADALQLLVIDLIDSNSSDYWIETDGTPSVYHVEEIDQNCLAVRLALNRMAS